MSTILKFILLAILLVLWGPDSFNGLCGRTYGQQLHDSGQESKQPAAEEPNQAVAASSTTDDEQQPQLTPDELAAIEFDPQQTNPIFTQGYQGSNKAQGQADPPPRFELFVDGKVIVRAADGKSEMRSQLSAEQVRSFLHFVVNEKRIYDYEPAAIQRQMAEVKPRTTLLDAPTSRFTVDLKRGKKTVEHYSLFNAKSNYPAITMLGNLLDVEKRCSAIAGKIYLGDDADAVLKFVNKAILDLNRDIAPVALEELRSAVRLPKGRFQVSFARELPAVDDGATVNAAPKTLNIIYFKKDAETEPVVKFYGLMKE